MGGIAFCVGVHRHSVRPAMLTMTAAQGICRIRGRLVVPDVAGGDGGQGRADRRQQTTPPLSGWMTSRGGRMKNRRFARSVPTAHLALCARPGGARPTLVALEQPRCRRTNVATHSSGSHGQPPSPPSPVSDWWSSVCCCPSGRAAVSHRRHRRTPSTPARSTETSLPVCRTWSPRWPAS